MSKNNHDIDKSYVSPYDIFLKQFDKKNPPSLSQIRERQKADRIARLRDVKGVEKGDDII